MPPACSLAVQGGRMLVASTSVIGFGFRTGKAQSD
jgi:hypothetical protein